MVYWLVSCYTVGVAAGSASAATECCQPASGLLSSAAAGIENECFIDNILMEIKDYNERTNQIVPTPRGRPPPPVCCPAGEPGRGQAQEEEEEENRCLVCRPGRVPPSPCVDRKPCSISPLDTHCRSLWRAGHSSSRPGEERNNMMPASHHMYL